MKSLTLRLSLIFSVVLVGLVGSAAMAQDDAPQGPVLGAINIIVPDLYVTPAGENETRLIAPSVFDPGDTLRTSDAGVGLVTWFYDGTESALGQNSSLTLNEFSGDASEDYVIDATLNSGQLVTGLGDIAANVSANGVMTIDTPSFTVRPDSGQFELRVDEMSGETTLIVTDGKVDVLAGDAEAFPVEAGQYLVGAPGVTQTISDDGVTPNIEGVCTAETPTNLNVRLAASEESRRLGGVQAGQVFWVRASTEGNLWLQVYYETQPDDEEGHNYGWIYGPAVTLNDETCGVLLRAPLPGMLYGGMGVDEPLGEEGESEPLEGETE
jgi:hypothetical protein